MATPNNTASQARREGAAGGDAEYSVRSELVDVADRIDVAKSLTHALWMAAEAVSDDGDRIALREMTVCVEDQLAAAGNKLDRARAALAEA